MFLALYCALLQILVKSSQSVQKTYVKMPQNRVFIKKKRFYTLFVMQSNALVQDLVFQYVKWNTRTYNNRQYIVKLSGTMRLSGVYCIYLLNFSIYMLYKNAK